MPRRKISGSQSVAENVLDVGPMDPSVLWGQSNHRSSDMHVNQQVSFRCMKVEDNIISEEAKAIVQAVGLWDVAFISHPKLDPKLLTTLCERWRPETHTFHLRHGEMTITLEDVAVLLGLRVHGEAVTDNYDEEEDIVGACVELLGLHLPVGRKDFIQIKQLRQNLVEAQLTAEQQARTFILIILGGVLFTTTKKDNVSLMYLPLLRNLKQAAQYSWGSAVLAATYRGLCEASQVNVATFSGCAILVQIWSWEHLHVGRPMIRGELPAGELHPLGYRWAFFKRSYNHLVKIANLVNYRDDLESLSYDQVMWKPYTALQLSAVPHVCLDQPELFRVKVPLIHFNIVEWHRPDRVMRQFGLNQHIPQITTEEIRDDLKLHKLTRKGTQIERRWTKMHQDYIALWINRAEYVQHEQQPRTEYNQYMTWYRNITCRFITEARPINQVPSLEHPSSIPDVSHEDQVEKVMEYIAKAVPVAKKAATGGLKFTKKNFKMLANHYLETCRLSLDALGQLSVYEEYVRRAEWDIAHERQRRERRTKRRHPESERDVREQGALLRSRNGESSSSEVYEQPTRFRTLAEPSTRESEAKPKGD